MRFDTPFLLTIAGMAVPHPETIMDREHRDRIVGLGTALLILILLWTLIIVTVIETVRSCGE